MEKPSKMLVFRRKEMVIIFKFLKCYFNFLLYIISYIYLLIDWTGEFCETIVTESDSGE